MLYDINVVTRYFRSINETRELESIPAQELNVILARFFVHIRKKDGGVYEPSTLTAFQQSIQQYLNDKGSRVNILKDQQFAKSRETLAARKRELVNEHAKGNRPQATRELTEAEENLLFEQGLFGDHMNLKFFKELSGGLLLFILVLELAMSQENLNGVIFILTEIQKPTMKFLFGMQKEAPKHAMATVNIDEHLIPPLKQQIQIVVLSNYSRNMHPIVQPK